MEGGRKEEREKTIGWKPMPLLATETEGVDEVEIVEEVD